MIGVHLDGTAQIQAYQQAFRRLAQLPGYDPRLILRAEAGSILKTWAGRTKVTTVAQIERRERKRVIRGLGYTTAESKGDVTVNAGWRPAPFGRVWIKVQKGRKFALAREGNFAASANRFSRRWTADVADAVADVTATLKNRLPMAKRSAGLARQSVVQIADALGINLANVAGGGLSTAGLAKARAALASSGRYYRNGTGAAGGNEVRAYVDLINRLPYGPRIGMDRTLAIVIAGRAKFIEQAFAKGAFSSMSSVARSFPNIIRVGTRFELGAGVN